MVNDQDLFFNTMIEKQAVHCITSN